LLIIPLSRKTPNKVQNVVLIWVIAFCETRKRYFLLALLMIQEIRVLFGR